MSVLLDTVPTQMLNIFAIFSIICVISDHLHYNISGAACSRCYRDTCDVISRVTA